jgi:hypothetical protein
MVVKVVFLSGNLAQTFSTGPQSHFSFSVPIQQKV